LAKLAADTPPNGADLPSANKAPTLTPKVAGKQFAQLTYPVPTTASAADLLLAADDYAFYTDYDHCRQYLQQVVSAHPGTKEAGRALALLADDAAHTGDPEAAAAYSAQLAGYADPEVQAFAALIATVNPAENAKQYPAAEQAYLAYLQTWKGTASAGWAALRLGDLYRFDIDDSDRAAAILEGLVKDYQTDPVAEEALVSLAETINWSESGRQEEANALYQQALDTARIPGVQVRALYGLADTLMQVGELSLAGDLFTQIIDSYPTHPSAALAYAKRSGVAEKRGDWEQTLADVKVFLTYPSSSKFQIARAHWILAKDAFRNSRLDEAEAEFSLLAQLAETTRHNAEFKGEARAGLAYCAQGRGDLRGAMQTFQQAADVEVYPQKKAVYLFQAAQLARQVGDDAARNSIITRMIAEVPGSHLTTQLVGHEILPAPEI
jgi:tetratricopeptide (TPR) repeat protein